jgi:signal transduction histidine kinase
MRRVLGVLHEDGTDTTPLAPQPGGDDLDALVERFRAAGLPVRTTQPADDGLARLDPSLQLTVFRLVQEALTNTLRHAPGTPDVEVAVRETPEHVEVVVADGGPAGAPVPAVPGSRRGLVGMRERVAVFGGTVETGPWGPGWRVRAVLPRPEVTS